MKKTTNKNPVAKKFFGSTKLSSKLPPMIYDGKEFKNFKEVQQYIQKQEREQAWKLWNDKNIDETVATIKGWNKYGNNIKIDWCPVLLVVLIIGVVIAILV